MKAIRLARGEKAAGSGPFNGSPFRKINSGLGNQITKGAGDNFYSIWMAELNLTEFARIFLTDKDCKCQVHSSKGSANAKAKNWHFAVPVFNHCHCTMQQGAKVTFITAVYLKVQINVQTWIVCLQEFSPSQGSGNYLVKQYKSILKWQKE